LNFNAETALKLIGKMAKLTDKELRLTLGDLSAMSHLGNNYSEKIMGATDLALFEKTTDPRLQASSVCALKKALNHWQQYANVATAQYRPQLLTRIGVLDLQATAEYVQRDITLAKEMKSQ